MLGHHHFLTQTPAFNLGELVLDHFEGMNKPGIQSVSGFQLTVKVRAAKQNGQVAQLLDCAKNYAGQVVWMRGALVMMKDGMLLDEALEPLLENLRGVEASVSAGCVQTEEFLSGPLRPAASQSLVAAVQALNRAGTELLEALRDIKHVLLEREADLDIKHGRTKRFTSMQDLIDDLDA